MKNTLFKPSLKYRVWGSLHLLFFLFLLGFLLLQSLAIQPLSLGEESFATQRAFQDLHILTREPRIPGSSFHRQVGEYIQEELKKLGLHAEIQKTTVLEDPQNAAPFYGGEVKNIVAKIPGEDPKGAIILGAPYDSIQAPLGSLDSAVAVAALLETARALSEGEPLANDILLLFADMSVFHSLGIKGFLEQHVFAREAQLFYFFEGIGPSSQTFRLETSPHSYHIIQDLSKAAPRALTSSLSYQLDALLHEPSDLYQLLENRYGGLEFALFSHRDYHFVEPMSPQEIRAALKEYGEVVLGIAKSYGRGDVTRTSMEDAIYFNVTQSLSIYYPQRFSWPFFIMIAALFLLLLIISWRQKRVDWKKSLTGFLLLPLLVLFGMGLIYFIAQSTSVSSLGLSYPYDVFLVSSLALALYLLLLLFFRERGEITLTAISIFFGILLLFGVVAFSPNFSYVLTWPLFFSLLSFLFQIFLPDKGIGFSIKNLLLGICSIPLLLLLVPSLLEVYPIMPQLGILLAILLSLLLTPLLSSIVSYFVITAPSLLLALALLSLALSMRGAPLPFQSPLLYSYDFQRERAVWATYDRDLDPFTSPIFEKEFTYKELVEVFPFSNQKYLQTKAPNSPLLPPELEVLLDNRMEQGRRTLNVLLYSPRGAPVISVYLMHGTTVLSSKVNNHRLTEYYPPEAYWGLTFYGLPEDGIELGLQFLADEPIHFRVIDRSYGLPGIEGYERDFKGGAIHPLSGPYGDSTFVSRSYLF